MKEITELSKEEIENKNENATAVLDIYDLSSLKNILHELDVKQLQLHLLREEKDNEIRKLKKQNEELKDKLQDLDEHYSKLYKFNRYECIRKDVIQNKIEELLKMLTYTAEGILQKYTASEIIFLIAILQELLEDK